jgi:hypothetical protein
MLLRVPLKYNDNTFNWSCAKFQNCDDGANTVHSLATYNGHWIAKGLRLIFLFVNFLEEKMAFLVKNTASFLKIVSQYFL